MRSVVNRLAQLFAVLLIVTFAATALINLVPGSPAYYVLGAYASKEEVAQFNEKYGLNLPVYDRYWHWVDGVFHGNLGESIVAQRPVGHLIKVALPVTVEIAIVTVVVAFTLAVVGGLISAMKPGGIVDHIITGLASLGTSIPVFVGAVILIYVFAIETHVFPPYGWVPLTQNFGQNLIHAALPEMTLVAVTTPLLIRVFRGDLVAVLDDDYITAARSRGLPEWYVMLRYAFRPASIGLLTVCGLTFGYLLGGSIIVETFFVDPGIGLMVSQAETSKDIPVVQAVVVIVACCYMVINLLVDLAYPLLDPRRRGRL